MVTRRAAVILFFFLVLALPFARADDAYKPYLHKPSVPDAPGVRLFGQYNTLLFPGAATYSYPIEVPAGTHGLQPSLVVYYNSQAAQQRPGVLGAGWSLNQNYIYRDVNSTPDNTADDRYILVFQNDVYELLYNPQDGQWHTEVDYHFRIQNMTSPNNLFGTAWLLTTTDGTQYRFGYTPDAERPSNTNRAYAVRWYQDRVTDTYGNTIAYTYNKDPNPGDSGTNYLASIAYNADQQRTITFTYENQPRPDARVVYEQGNKVSESRRLTDITVADQGVLVRRYHFTYATLGPSLTALAQLTRYGSDNTSILHTVTFGYQPAAPGYTQTTQWLPPVPLDNTTGGDTGVRLLDVNNDGYADILQAAQRTSTKVAWLNNHNGWTNTTAWLPPVYFVDTAGNDTGVRFADVNNDGLVDMLVSKAGSSQVWLNNGTNWTLSTWTIPVDFVNGAGMDQGVVLADVDGDGRVDIVRAKNGQQGQVFLNTGAGWSNATWSVPTTFNNGTSDTGARLLDINGDGLPDIVQANGSNSRSVWLNNGAGWTLSTWTIPVDFTNKTYQDTGVRFIDVDGDGLPDLVQNLINKTIAINNTWLNNGTGWTLNNSWQTPAAMVANQSNVGRRIADLNGDGGADLLTGANSTLQNPWLRNPGTPYLLTTITNEYGGTTQITYTTSTQYNNTDANGAGTIGFNIPVVQRILKNNSITGTQAVLGISNYSYSGGKYNYTKREFRGFSTTTEQTPSAVITHAFYQDNPRRGKEYATTIRGLDGTLYQTTVRDYNYTYLFGIYNLSLRSVVQSQYDGAAMPRTTSTLYTYDWFGNPLVVTEQGDVTVTGDERTTTYTYAYNKNAWVLNHPARITVTDALGQKVKETTNYYDNQGFTGIGAQGSLTSTEAWNNQGNNSVTMYEYDDYGNVLRATDSAGATTQYAYDTTHTYQVMTINALGHITESSYDPGTGNPLWTRRNGITTSYTYDVHGRILNEIQPYDSAQLPTRHYAYFLNGTAPSRVTVSLRSTANNTMLTSYYYDGFGNLLQLGIAREDDQVVKNLYYDGNARLVAEDNPYLAPTSTQLSAPAVVPQTNYTYDALDRVTLVRNPDGTNKTTIFRQANITDIDENDHRHMYTVDGLGRITAVYEYNPDPRLANVTDTYATTYEYDGNDNLLTITDALGNQFHFTYNSLGRKTGMQDPDMGNWTYAYDNRGNLITQTDARGQTITLAYDALSRILAKQSADVNATFTYDAQYQGTLSNISMNNVALQYTYDQRLRPVVTTQVIDGTPFTITSVYDSQNRIISEQGPGGKLDYLYDRQGKVRSIPGYITWSQYDAFGSLLTRTGANGLITTYTYDNQNHRLAMISIPSVQNLTYTYDNVGNIKSINDATTGKLTLLSYDGLDRLQEALIGGDRYEYNYNALGNMLSIIEDNQTKKFVYTSLAHAPTTIVEGGPGATVYHPRVLGNSKNKTVEFFLLNDQPTTTDGVNVSVAFGDGNQVGATNLSVNGNILFLIQNNYTSGGDYIINVTSTAPNSASYLLAPTKFGVRALGISLLASNVTQRTFEFDLASDVVEPLPNVSWACTGANSTIPITLTGSLFDYLRVNYTSPGPQTFACTAGGPDGNESKSLGFTIDGLSVASFDTLYTNVSRRVVGFNAKNSYFPLQANISVAGENAAFSTLANLTTDEAIMVFAEVNNTVGDAKGLTVQLAAGPTGENYTSLYNLKAASIDSYQRVDLTNTTKVLLYDVRNQWENGTVSWKLSDPDITRSTTLGNNERVLVMIATNYTQGDKTPTLTVTSAGYNASITDHFQVKPVAIGLLTLTDGSSTVAELTVQNALGAPQNVTWNYNTGEHTFTDSASVGSSILIFLQTNYTASGVHTTTASANTTDFNDSTTGVVIA